MSLRRANKKDQVQYECEEMLDKLHVRYADTSSMGDDFPDMVLDWNGHNPLVECKTGNRKLRQGQHDFFDLWQGPHWIVRSKEELLQKMGLKP